MKENFKENSVIIAKHVAHESKNAFFNALDIFKLNFKSLIRSRMFPFMVAVFFAMVLIAAFVFVPYNWGVGLFFIAYLQLPCLIIMGWVTYNVMNSVIYKNIRISGIGTVSFFVAQFATIFVIGNILTLVFWPIVWIMAHYGLFITSWADKTSQLMTPFNPFSNFTWILILYCVQLNIGVSFAFYFILQFWVTNIKVYYLIVVPTILLTIIFGGVINDYFFRAVGYSGDYTTWLKENAEAGVDYKIHDGIYYVTEDYYSSINDQIWSMDEIGIRKNIFPIWMFPFTLLFPYYGVGQFASTAIALNSTWSITWEHGNNIQMIMVSDLNTLDPSAGIEVSSVVQDFSIEFHDWFTVNPFAGNSWTWWLVLLQPYLIIFFYLFIGISSDVVQRVI